MTATRHTGWAAPKDRYTTPVLFNPYTGEPRDVRDVQSDPQGILIVPPGALQLAATQPTASNAGEREWTIGYDNDTGFSDEGFEEWWSVTDGQKSFRCDSEDDANFLRAALASKPPQPVRPESVLKTLMTLNAYRAGLYGLCQGPEPETLEDALEHLRARLHGKPPAGEQKPVGEGFFTPDGECINASATIGYLGLAHGDAERGCTIRQLYTAPQPEQVAQDSLPASYDGGVMTTDQEGATVRMHFTSAAEGEAWFNAITDRWDRAARARGEGERNG